MVSESIPKNSESPSSFFKFFSSFTMSSTLSSTTEIPVSNSNTFLNVNMANITKLTTSNFMMWSLQIHALLDGYDLAGFIDGSAVIPPVTI